MAVPNEQNGEKELNRGKHSLGSPTTDAAAMLCAHQS